MVPLEVLILIDAYIDCIKGYMCIYIYIYVYIHLFTPTPLVHYHTNSHFPFFNVHKWWHAFIFTTRSARHLRMGSCCHRHLPSLLIFQRYWSSFRQGGQEFDTRCAFYVCKNGLYPQKTSEEHFAGKTWYTIGFCEKHPNTEQVDLGDCEPRALVLPKL